MAGRWSEQLSGLRDAGLSDTEIAALCDLSLLQDLSPVQVLRQALRLYQLQAIGKVDCVSLDEPIGCPNFD